MLLCAMGIVLAQVAHQQRDLGQHMGQSVISMRESGRVTAPASLTRL